MTLGASRSMDVDCVYSLGCSLLLEFGSRCNFEIHKIITGKGTGKILAALWLFQVFSRIVVLCRVCTDSLLFSTFILSFFRFPFGGDLQLILSMPLTYC